MTDQTNYRDDLPDEDCPGFLHECDNCEEVGCDFYNANKDIEDWLTHQ